MPNEKARTCTYQYQQMESWVDQRRWWFWAFLALVWVLGFNAMWRIGTDSALYLVIGRNVAEGAGYLAPQGISNQIPPGVPWLTAAVFAVFGQGNLWPLVAIIWLMGVSSLVLLYAMVKMNAGRPTAVIVTVMVGLTETVYRYAYQVLAEMPFLFGLMLLLFAYEIIMGRKEGWKRGWAWGMIALGMILMTLFRSPALVVMGAVVLSCIWRLLRGPKRWRSVLMIALVILSVAAAMGLDRTFARRPGLVSAHAPMRDERAVLHAVQQGPLKWWNHIRNISSKKMLEETAVESATGTEWFPIVNTVLSVLVIGLGLALVRRRVLWGVLVASFVFQFLMFDPVDRYFLPLIPMLAMGWFFGAAWFNRHLSQPWAGWVLAVLLGLWIVPNLVKIAEFAWEQRKIGFIEHYADGRYVPVKTGASRLASFTPDNAIILMPNERWHYELMYLSNRELWVSRLPIETQTNRPIYILASTTEQAQKLAETAHWDLGTPIGDTGRIAGDQRTWNLFPAASHDAGG